MEKYIQKGTVSASSKHSSYNSSGGSEGSSQIRTGLRLLAREKVCIGFLKYEKFPSMAMDKER